MVFNPYDLLVMFIPTTLPFFSEIGWFVCALLRITDLGSKNYQRNSGGCVGVRLIRLPVFALQLGSGMDRLNH